MFQVIDNPVKPCPHFQRRRGSSAFFGPPVLTLRGHIYIYIYIHIYDFTQPYNPPTDLAIGLLASYTYSTTWPPGQHVNYWCCHASKYLAFAEEDPAAY